MMHTEGYRSRLCRLCRCVLSAAAVAAFVVLLHFVQAYTQKTASSGEGAAEWMAQTLCRSAYHFQLPRELS